MQKRLRISLVIPVYNEESYLEDCLRSALAQDRPFDEIIVVDNNSTDATARIALRFPGVTVLHEPRQGVVHARNRGFDAVRGDIIARIDADTRLPQDWTDTVAVIFADSSIDAVSGQMRYYDMAAPRLYSAIDLFARRFYAATLGDQVPLQAANMALRRRAWLKIRTQTCQVGGIHEDFDLAIHAYRAGHIVTFDERLVAHIAYRQVEGSFIDFCKYTWLAPHTYRLHRARGHWLMYPAAALSILSFGFLKALHTASNDRGELKVRVNPATFID